MQKTINNLEIKQRWYIDMRANWELKHNEFIELKNWITNEIINLRNRLNEIQRLDQEILSKMSYWVELLVNLSDKRKTLNNGDKLSIIDTLIMELVIDKEKMAFIREKPLFQFIRNFNKFHLVGQTRHSSNFLQNHVWE